MAFWTHWVIADCETVSKASAITIPAVAVFCLAAYLPEAENGAVFMGVSSWKKTRSFWLNIAIPDDNKLFIMSNPKSFCDDDAVLEIDFFWLAKGQNDSIVNGDVQRWSFGVSIGWSYSVSVSEFWTIASLISFCRFSNVFQYLARWISNSGICWANFCDWGSDKCGISQSFQFWPTRVFSLSIAASICVLYLFQIRSIFSFVPADLTVIWAAFL